MPVFIEGIPESKDGNILVNMAVQSAGGNQTTRVNLKNGWQILSQEILAKAKGTNITTVAFGFAGSGDTTLTAEEKKSVNMYVNGLYYSDDNTLTASPVIPDGQANVCNGLTTYRIKFNKPLAFDLTSDELADSVSITYGTDGSISDLSVVPGTDYIDVIISADSLSTDGTEYTVTVAANKVRDCYGAYYAGGPFTFSTIGNGCTTATPVPFVTYPKAGSLNATDAALAASVIFNANVSKVEFFEIAADGTTETSLGEATKATNEWVLSPATAWSTGSHTVYAKVTTTAAENNVFSSEAVTFTVAEKTDYRLVGIEDGDTVVVNENLGTTVSVIDDNTDTFTVRDGKGNGGGHADGTVTYNDPDATASNVDRVIYYLNNEKVAEVNAAPYSTDLDIVKLGQNSNTLKVEIYDQLGCLTTISKTFNAAYGYVQNGYDEDFDGTNPVIPENMINLHPDAEPTSGTDYWKQEVTTFGESKALSIYGGNNYEHWVAMGLWPVALDVSSGLNRVFLEFDYSVNQYSGNLPALCLREDSTIGNNNKANSAPYAVINLPIDELKSSNKSFKTTRLGFDISWNDATQQITYKVYLNNLECYRRTTLYSYKQKIDPTNLIAVLNLDRDTVWQWYIDNIHVAAYSIPDDVSVFANGKQEREYDEAGNAEITVANISADTDATVMNFVAVYDSSDRLVSITPYEIDLDAKTLSDETYPVSLAAGQYAKIFTWFDGTLKPVTLK